MGRIRRCCVNPGSVNSASESSGSFHPRRTWDQCHFSRNRRRQNSLIASRRSPSRCFRSVLRSEPSNTRMGCGNFVLAASRVASAFADSASLKGTGGCEVDRGIVLDEVAQDDKAPLGARQMKRTIASTNRTRCRTKCPNAPVHGESLQLAYLQILEVGGHAICASPKLLMAFLAEASMPAVFRPVPFGQPKSPQNRLHARSRRRAYPAVPTCSSPT